MRPGQPPQGGRGEVGGPDVQRRGPILGAHAYGWRCRPGRYYEASLPMNRRPNHAPTRTIARLPQLEHDTASPWRTRRAHRPGHGAIARVPSVAGRRRVRADFGERQRVVGHRAAQRGSQLHDGSRRSRPAPMRLRPARYLRRAGAEIEHGVRPSRARRRAGCRWRSADPRPPRGGREGVR